MKKKKKIGLRTIITSTVVVLVSIILLVSTVINYFVVKSKVIKELDEKAGILLNKIQELNIDADIQKEKNVSQVGGGSMPLEKLDTYTVTIKPNKFSVSYLEKRLRKSDAHIIGRINEDKYILDVRTIEENEFDLIVKELKIIFN